MNNKKKYLLQIMIIIITSFLIFNIFFYLQLKKSYKNSFYEVGDKITTQTSNALKNWVEDQIRIVKTIAKDERIIDVCRFPQNDEIVNNAEKYLLDVHGSYPYYENLPISVKLDKPIVRSINGKEITINSGEFLIDTVDGKTVGKGGTDYSYIKEIFNGKDYYISEIYPSILRNNPIFVISAPIKYNSEIVGVAIISPQISYFTKIFLDNVKFGETGYMFFVDERESIIAHPNRNLILSSHEEAKFIGKEVIKRFSKNENFFSDCIYKDTKFYIGTKVNIELENIKYDWYIVFTQTKDEVFNNSNKFLFIVLIMIVIATVIVVWAISIVSKINQKELYEEELKNINKCLEKKVEERTKELERIAITDSLSNLFNHQTSYKILKEEICKKKDNDLSLFVIMADLDRFKNINDKFGHQVGDMVIKSTAKIILSNIKATDIAGRYGGEEFIIILPDTELEDAVEIANRIKEDIANKEFSYKDLRVTISIGLCKWNGESDIELVNKADKLLYKAKQNGRNRIEIG